MKEFVKRLAERVAGGVVLPAVVGYWAGALVLGRVQALAGWAQALALWPGTSGVYLRRAFYRYVLPQCGEGSVISFGTLVSHPTARIGRHVYVGPYSMLGDVTLEDDVLVSSHVSILNGSRQHGIERLDRPVRLQPGTWPRVTIGRDSWIGERAVVMADVGRHCVVGAGAVVTRPVPDGAIVAGVPARVIGWRCEPGAMPAVPPGQPRALRPSRPAVAAGPTQGSSEIHESSEVADKVGNDE
jgi:acetyltransferase-like isoleucine patch superfamily enzyme